MIPFVASTGLQHATLGCRAWWSDADMDHPHDPGHWHYIPEGADMSRRLVSTCVDPNTEPLRENR